MYNFDVLLTCRQAQMIDHDFMSHRKEALEWTTVGEILGTKHFASF